MGRPIASAGYARPPEPEPPPKPSLYDSEDGPPYSPPRTPSYGRAPPPVERAERGRVAVAPGRADAGREGRAEAGRLTRAEGGTDTVDACGGGEFTQAKGKSPTALTAAHTKGDGSKHCARERAVGRGLGAAQLPGGAAAGGAGACRRSAASAATRAGRACSDSAPPGEKAAARGLASARVHAAGPGGAGGASGPSSAAGVVVP
jgi:hypothetical protein